MPRLIAEVVRHDVMALGRLRAVTPDPPHALVPFVGGAGGDLAYEVAPLERGCLRARSTAAAASATLR